MTRPAEFTRRSTPVQAMRLDSPRELHAAEVWLRAHRVEAAVRHPHAGDGLLIATGAGGITMPARMGQWLIRCKEIGDFTVEDDSHFWALHHKPLPESLTALIESIS